MKKEKWMFVQALLVTVVVFLIGMYIGILTENGRVTEINDYYLQSEISMIDILTLNNMINSGEFSCSSLEKANFDFVDRIYREAKTLEDYETSSKMTENLKSLHKKYDVLRTLMWVNLIQTKEICDSNYSTIVYLYDYDEEDLDKKAKQNVWSKLLFEIKSENENLFLIPIARDTNLGSLEAILSKYNKSESPMIIINEKIVLTDLIKKEEIEALI